MVAYAKGPLLTNNCIACYIKDANQNDGASKLLKGLLK